MARLRLQSRTPRFWPLQIGGWLLYAVATAISYIPFRHMREQVDYRVAFIGTTFLASFIAYALCRYLWRKSKPVASAMFLVVLLSYGLGVCCTALSAILALHFADDSSPVSWSMVSARAFEAAIVFIAWSALYFGLKHLALVEEQRRRLFDSEASAREAQLQALRYQLHPHFLFNTLNAISSLVVSKQPELATQMITKLAALLRTSLSSPATHEVTLREELALVEEYLSIEQVRFGSRLTVRLVVSPPAFEAHVPRFLLQPLVENAIRHGVSRRTLGGEVVIRAAAADGYLQLEIENDSSDRCPSVSLAGHGLGLTNTRARLDKLYGGRANVVITEREDRFLLSVSFPLHSTPSAELQGKH